MGDKIRKTDDEWRKELTPDQYRIAREAGTEPAFTGEYYEHDEAGTYHCTCCGHPLFHSDAKYHSGSGWPSFHEPVAEEHVDEHGDASRGMTRTEVRCSRCDAHLGHVFPDGPGAEGKRYCINSASLKHREKDDDAS
jgi:peptide-methionine (R)-S-oxide reductase